MLFVFYLDTPEHEDWLRQRMPQTVTVARGIVESRLLGLLDVPTS